MVQPDLNQTEKLVRRRSWSRLIRGRGSRCTAALFVATHWPALVLPSVVPVSDKTIHFVAWGIWLALLSAAGRLPLGLLLVTGLACSVADEASQAIPVLNRHASLMDAVANVIGIVAVWSWVVSGRHRMWDEVGLGHSFCRLLRVGVD